MNMRMHRRGQFGTILIFLIIIGIIIGVFFFVRRVQTNALGLVTARSGDNREYPDSGFTPGDVKTTDASLVCISSYGKNARNIPVELQKQVFHEYSLTYPNDDYEIDHLVPLELGGSNDIKNLWPQSKETAPRKNEVEAWLRRQVCEGTFSLEAAQNALKTDWLAQYQKMG